MNDNKFMLSSLLLVCDPNLPAKCTFFWLGTINSENNKIELIAFRTDKKSEIIFELLSKTLKEEREKQGKSLRLLADEFDIQKSLISRLENGVNEPKLISLWTLCEE